MRALAVVATLPLLIALASGSAHTGGDNYGAIAVAPDGAFGYSYDHPSRAAAEKHALHECGSGDCGIKVWFKNNCAAYARGRRAEGWAYADSRREAELVALKHCASRGNGCEIVCWACNSR